jgi:hypothetical protein
MSGPTEPRKERPEVKLDPGLQERLLEQMREEQAAALRAREIRNWVLLPTAVFCIVVGVVNAFSDDLMIAFVANTLATGIGAVLWRVNREWIRNTLGF